MLEFQPAKGISEKDVLYFRKSFNVSQEKLLLCKNCFFCSANFPLFFRLKLISLDLLTWVDCNCSLWEGMLPCQGWMYLSKNFVCFTSPFLKENVNISIKEVVHVSVKKGRISSLYIMTSEKKVTRVVSPKIIKSLKPRRKVLLLHLSVRSA